jgi:transcriptional regulator with PAS, ATPase and Fis domain
MSTINGVLLQNSGVVMRDSTTFFQDNEDTTKQLQFELSGFTTGTTRTLTIPDISDTLVTLDATQTLTNKTITMGGNLDLNGKDIVDGLGSVRINDDAVITGAVSVDTINENSEDVGVTVDGVLLKDGGVTLKDSTTFFQDDSDNTKQLQLQLSELTTATTRTLTAPDASGVITLNDATQTLTNKTITMGGALDMNGQSIVDTSEEGSVTIDDDAVITGAVSVDTINEHTAAAGVTVDGMLIKDGGVTLKDSTTFIQDDSDNTKQLQLQLSELTTATTRTLTVPDASGVITLNDATQTLTNKTITMGGALDMNGQNIVDTSEEGSVTIDDDAVITGSVAVDTVNEHTAAAGVTVDGVLLKDGGATLKDSTTFFQDDSDNTKQLQLQLSELTTATTRTLTVPDASGVITLNDATQTLTNKTITMGGALDMNGQNIVDTSEEGSVTIDDDAVITGAVSVDTINEHTAAAGVTVDGMLIKDGGATLKDSTTFFQDDSDNTKQLQLQLSELTTATTRTLTVPDASGVITLNDATQTLTNKTITMGGALDMNGQNIVDTSEEGSVTIDDDAIITGAVAVDTVNEHTAAAGVTVDGVLLKDGGATLKDSTTFFQDNEDATKQLQLQLADITTATTRTLTVPDASGEITLNDATQTLTNKTITMGGALDMNGQNIVDTSEEGSVTIDDDAVITGSVAVDTINEHTAAAGVTVDGVLLKDGGATLKDSTTFFQDNEDATKQLQLQLSSITTATTHTLTVPDASGTITLNDATQTLTNKTITMGGALDMNGKNIVDGLGSVTIDDDLVVTGNLTINGTTTSVESTTVTINDNLLVLNSGPSASKDGGVLVERYQTANDAGTGDVVSDPAAFSDDLGDQTGASSTEVILPVGASVVNDFYNGWWIKVVSGSSADQVRKIVDYDGASRTATLATEWTTQNPASGDTVSLHNKPFVGSFYNESDDTWTLAATASDPGAGAVVIQDYINLHINELLLEGPINVDTIDEKTVGVGVTVDGVLLKDGGATLKDSTTFFQDNEDATKQLQLQLADIATATTRTLTVPNASGTITLNDATQTLTNKTITMGGTLDMKGQNIVDTTEEGSVTIDDDAVITGAVSVDTINEYTAAAGVTVDGVLLKDGGITLKDSTTFFQDDADSTKQLQLQLADITTATTRTLTVPDASGEITLNDATQTLTNKTITMGGALDMNGQNIVDTSEEGSVTVDDNLYVTGNITTDGNITATSSIRYKENIVELSASDVSNVANLRPVVYNRIGNSEVEYGFIAEEVAKLYPDLVHYTEIDGQVVPESLNYTRIIVPLVAQVKALRSELNNVLERLSKLE